MEARDGYPQSLMSHYDNPQHAQYHNPSYRESLGEIPPAPRPFSQTPQARDSCGRVDLSYSDISCLPWPQTHYTFPLGSLFINLKSACKYLTGLVKGELREVVRGGDGQGTHDYSYMGGFPKIRAPFWGIPRVRTIVVRGA